jgi:hypothetical protein
VPREHQEGLYATDAGCFEVALEDLSRMGGKRVAGFDLALEGGRGFAYKSNIQSDPYRVKHTPNIPDCQGEDCPNHPDLQSPVAHAA